MVCTMRIKLKDSSILSYVDEVFSSGGFTKKELEGGELEYVASGKGAFGSTFTVMGNLDYKQCLTKMSKWTWTKVENGREYSENCLEELTNAGFEQ